MNDFRKSSLCPHNAHCCVAVAYKNEMIALRDTKNPKQAPLYFTKDEWESFIGGVKNNEFDF